MGQDTLGGVWPEIGDRVRSLRRDAGLTQQELADAVELSRPSIANLEAGRQRVALDELYVIADVLGVQIGALLPGASSQREPSQEAARLRRRIAYMERLLARYRHLAGRLSQLG